MIAAVEELATTAATRAPGRPRSAHVHAAIQDAVIAVLAEDGFAALSMDKVAARAGVGKATIYRRWPSKLAMVIDVISERADDALPMPDTGTLRGDLCTLAGLIADAMARPDAHIFFGMLSEAVRNEDLGEAVREGFVSSRRTEIRAIFDRAAGRGELRADADLEVAVDVLIGAVFHRALFLHAPTDRAFADGLVDVIVRGVAAPPVSGGAPSGGRTARR